MGVGTGEGLHPFARDLDRNAANYVPLSPVSFLERSAFVYPGKVAVRHGDAAWSYAEFDARCRRLASALARRGIGHGDTVAIIAPNVPAMLEAHYAVPALGAILNPLNIRLDARTIATCLAHGEAKVLLTDAEFAPVVRDAVGLLGRPLLVVDLDDAEGPGHGDPASRLGAVTYDALLAEGDPHFAWPGPAGRVGRAGAPVHVGHDGRSQGRRLSPPRCVPQRAGQRARIRADAGVGVSVDAADVPLQRLDVHVGRHRRRRHARVPAPRRACADLPRDRRAPGDPPLRRAGGPQPARTRARRQPGGASSIASTSRPGARRRRRPSSRRWRRWASG